MAMPKKYASDADRKAARIEAQRQRRREAVKPIEALAQVEAGTGKPIEAVKPIEAETLDDAASCPPGFVAFEDCRHVPHDGPLWAGAGRGTPRTYQGARFVLVARGTVDPEQPEHGVVTLADWSARLAQYCRHGFAGWSCHVC